MLLMLRILCWRINVGLGLLRVLTVIVLILDKNLESLIFTVNIGLNTYRWNEKPGTMDPDIYKWNGVFNRNAHLSTYPLKWWIKKGGEEPDTVIPVLFTFVQISLKVMNLKRWGRSWYGDIGPFYCDTWIHLDWGAGEESLNFMRNLDLEISLILSISLLRSFPTSWLWSDRP